MKKLALAVFVAATFIIYSVQQRKQDTTSVVQPNTTTSTTTAPAQSAPVNKMPAAAYKDGQYTGTAADAYYGYIQVVATIQSGKITDITFLQAPNDRSTSVRINSQADPYLKQEAIQAQSTHVDIISGATDSSQAFMQSLASALNQARP